MHMDMDMDMDMDMVGLYYESLVRTCAQPGHDICTCACTCTCCNICMCTYATCTYHIHIHMHICTIHIQVHTHIFTYAYISQVRELLHDLMVIALGGGGGDWVERLADSSARSARKVDLPMLDP